MGRAAGGMDPDRPIQLGHPPEERREPRFERVSVDVREDLDAERPEVAAGAPDLAKSCVGVSHGQRRGEGHEPVGYLAHSAAISSFASFARSAATGGGPSVSIGGDASVST
jgi:hypothetical protein